MANKVGPLIKEARTAAGLTQEKLAAKINGLSAADLSKAERGELELTQTQLKEIAKQTDVTQKSLLDAAKASTYKVSSATKTSAAKSSSSKASSKASSKSTSGKSEGTSMKVSSSEKKLIELYREADSDTKKAAVAVLKGTAQIDKGILSNILGSVSSSGSADDLLSSLINGAASGLLGK